MVLIYAEFETCKLILGRDRYHELVSESSLCNLRANTNTKKESCSTRPDVLHSYGLGKRPYPHGSQCFSFNRGDQRAPTCPSC